jgi:hypothetical protein
MRQYDRPSELSRYRQRLNVHGAIDLETGKTRMLDVVTVNAVSTIMLLMAIEALYPGKRMIHLFLDNARYHHAKLVQAWLARPECRIKLHFIPAYCPHLDSIGRLWGNRSHPPSPFQIGVFGGRGVGCEANKGSCVAGRSSVYGLYATLKHPGSDRSRTSPAFGTVSAGA